MNPMTFAQIQRDLERYPRMHGYYLCKTVRMQWNWEMDEERSLTTAFEALDDHPWPPHERHPVEQRGADYEVVESQAREHTVTALVGGIEIGHARETIPHDIAILIWDRFRKLFSPQARFFVRLSLGDPEYVFQSGAVVVDEEYAGCLWVVESD